MKYAVLHRAPNMRAWVVLSPRSEDEDPFDRYEDEREQMKAGRFGGELKLVAGGRQLARCERAFFHGRRPGCP